MAGGRGAPRLLREALRGLVSEPDARTIETGIDIVGDIAIVKLGPAVDAAVVGEGILRALKNVKAVYNQEGGVEGEYRLRRLRHSAGERRTTTTHRENGCQFRVDVERCYFSPRLSTERLRVVEMVRDGERVLNMFAGVGPFSIPIARRRKGASVVSCELNAVACEYHLENNRLNKVESRVRVVNADAAELARGLEERFDRVLMPHPSQADRYLAAARSHLADGAGWIHYYRHLPAENFSDAEQMIRAEVRGILGEAVRPGVRRVREVGKRYLELAADIRVD